MTASARHKIRSALIIVTVLAGLPGCIIVDDYSSSKAVYQGKQLQVKGRLVEANKSFERAAELAQDSNVETKARQALAENLERRGRLTPAWAERERLVALGDKKSLQKLAFAITKTSYRPVGSASIATALQDAADRGSVTASLALGDLLRRSKVPDGTVSPKDPESWYQKAASGGSVTAAGRLVDLAAVKGDVKAVQRLAALDKKKSPSEVYKRLAKSFDEGSGGFARDAGKAELYWQMAGGRPTPKTPRDLVAASAKALTSAKTGTERKRLIAFLDSAARGGNGKAAYALARYYAPQGEASADEALKYYALAVANGEKRAVDEVVVGTIRPNTDPELANSVITGLEKAAKDGSAEAALGLAQMYLNGTAVQADANQSTQWFRRAATLGSQEAQFRLGVMLTGQPDEAAVKEGKDWLQRAALKGSKSAKTYLDRLIATQP